MTNPYDEYQIDIVDVSKFQDIYETEKKPDVSLLVRVGIAAIVVRIGFGLVMDRMFKWFWSTAKGKLQRKGYWYGDYYSHRKDPVLAPQKITDYHWGEMQADKTHVCLDGDYGEAGPVVWDAEESPVGWKINWTKRRAYNQVLKGYHDRWKVLTGQIIEIYSSPGFIPNFEDWVLDLTLWAAWYDRTLTKAQIIAECRRKGWRGPILIWQYASDGDINMDGVGDGIALGMETKDLDLNAWLGTVEEWSKYCGKTLPVEVIPPEVIPPEVVPGAPSPTITCKLMRVVARDGLNIRNVPLGVTGSTVQKWMPAGTLVAVLATITSGDNVWHRVGYEQWCAERYNGSTFLQEVT